MSGINEKQAEKVVKKLMLSDVDQLYEDLGVRVKAHALDPAATLKFESLPTYDNAQMGARDEIRNFGKRYLKRIMVSANDLICGDSQDSKDDRDKIRSAFGISSTAVTAAIAVSLATSLGIAAAIAAVVATLIVKIFFKNAYDEFCATWKQKLG